MSALRKAQFEYDELLPPSVNEDHRAETEWLEHSAEQLVCGFDITWKRRSRAARVITADQYATYLQGHLNQRQIDGLDQRDSFARIVLASIVGSQSEARTHAADLLGEQRPVEAVEKIAMAMLRPYAADAVAAERESREDEVDGDL